MDGGKEGRVLDAFPKGSQSKKTVCTVQLQPGPPSGKGKLQRKAVHGHWVFKGDAGWRVNGEGRRREG